MKYKTIRIYPIKDKWKVEYSIDDQDRIKTKTTPFGAGFYHYPETTRDKTALKKLVNCMIKCHNKEIKKLLKSKIKLYELL